MRQHQQTHSNTKAKATSTDSSTKPVATSTDSNTNPEAASTDSSTKPEAALTDSNTNPVAALTDSNTNPVATLTDGNTKPEAALTDSNTKPEAALTDSHSTRDMSTLSSSSTITHHRASPNPFSHLSISPADCLINAKGRRKCPECGKSCKYFCHTCCIVTLPLSDGQQWQSPPIVRLPCRLVIVKHPGEYHGKSTSCHAALLSPECRIARYPAVPQLPDECLLAFPSEDAVEVGEAAAGRTGIQLEQWLSRLTIVFVDSTWHQANSILSDPRLAAVSRVRLSGDRVSHYWRHQRHLTPNHLSTIEAIYYFFVELHVACYGSYDGRYDNLLFYFSHLYTMLYKQYNGGKDCSQWKRRHFVIK